MECYSIRHVLIETFHNVCVIFGLLKYDRLKNAVDRENNVLYNTTKLIQ